MQKGSLQTTAHEKPMLWPYRVPDPEDLDEGEGAEGADEAEEAEGTPKEWPCCEGWYAAGGHFKIGKELICGTTAQIQMVHT